MGPPKFAEISPDALSFSLEEERSSRVILKVKNVKDKVCAFKVKTTKPKVYVVRPNQGLLLPGQQFEVTIALNERDKRSIIQEAKAAKASGKPPSACTDKFQVQIAPLSVEDGDRLARLEGKERQDVLAALWPSFDMSEVESKKLTVKHSISLDSRAQGERNHPGFGIQNLSSASGGSLSEAENLQKRYDELLKFSVTRVEERDQLRIALENSKNDLDKERTARKAMEAAAGDLRPGKPMPSIVRNQKKKQQNKGFSLFFVVIFGFISLYMGKKYGARNHLIAQEKEDALRQKNTQQKIHEVFGKDTTLTSGSDQVENEIQKHHVLNADDGHKSEVEEIETDSSSGHSDL